ncbi:ATP-dependent DNA helicase PIF1, partial [Trifolium medium]|nr:ATP-dependent DNA helicase PIF1 [Trifolium medium]
MNESDIRKNIARDKRRERQQKLKLKRLKIPRFSTRLSIRRGLTRSKAGKASLLQTNWDVSHNASSSHASTSYFDDYCTDHDISNFEIFHKGEVQDCMDIGDMDTVCPSCGAFVWYGEKAEKDRATSSFQISLCCKKGKIKLPFMIEPPPLIRHLFNGIHPRSTHFLANVRSYNNMFSFTSLGSKIESRLNDGAGPPQFVISGQNYHRIGSLLPNDGQSPKFAQLYIYDTQNEVNNRLSHFSFTESNNQLDPILVTEILSVMDEHNKLVQSFRMVRDYIQINENVPISLRLFRDRVQDPRVYNVPDVDEIAALIVGDIGDGKDGRDIIVRGRDGYMQRNNQTKIRSDFLMGIEEAVSHGNVIASSIGARIVLPSSFTGGRRYLFNNCQDAMAICKKYGYPDLFLTVTCNPKWLEIQRHMSKSGNYPVYRPDISCRVFQLKLEEMMDDFRKGKFFGRVIANSRDKLHSSDANKSVICAELPDKDLFPKLYSTILNFMIHGPCGNAFPKSP